MHFIFLFLMLNSSFFCYSQVKISGLVKSADSSALSYVNIGIKQKNVGTISGTSGQFALILPAQNLQDTLTFSYVGFEELNIPLQSVIGSSNHICILTPKATQLAEVVVTGKQLKQKRVGIKSRNPFVSGTAQSENNNDIIEFVKFIDINNKAARIESVSVYLLGVRIDTAIFRINFYNVKDNMPADKIINKNIIERMSVKKGWLTINLSKENIVLNKNFFVGFEFMPQINLPEYSLTYGAQLGGAYITRKSSLGSWQKGKGASFSAYVSLLQ